MESINRTAIARGHARDGSSRGQQREDQQQSNHDDEHAAGSMAFLFNHQRVFEDTAAEPWGPHGALRLPPGTEREVAARGPR
jgi:hypothetical protein